MPGPDLSPLSISQSPAYLDVGSYGFITLLDNIYKNTFKTLHST